jgi:hypothetical protein
MRGPTGWAEKKMSLWERMAPHTMAASWNHVSMVLRPRCIWEGLTIHMPACAMGAVPAPSLATFSNNTTALLKMTHTNPQVVVQRLSFHLTGISSPSQKRLLFALAARRSGSWWDARRRSHDEGRKSCERSGFRYGRPQRYETQEPRNLRTSEDGEA